MVEVLLNTPLAEALNMAIQPKLSELGWGSGGADDTAMAEYIVLMLVNGKTQDEIADELSADFLQLPPDDPSAKQFVQWLFQQIDVLSAQLSNNGTQQPPQSSGEQPGAGAQEDMAMDDASMADDTGEQINAPTGPKSMRAGNNFRGGREKRMVGQINRTLNQSNDSVLHRTRGQSGVQRGPPTGPRMGAGRQPRAGSNRAAVVGHGLAAQGVPGFQSGPGAPGMNGRNPSMGNGWGMMPQQPSQFDMMAMLQEQQLMIQQMMAAQQGGNMMPPATGKSLFERVKQPHNNSRGGRGGARGGQHNGRYNNNHHNNSTSSQPSNDTNAPASGESVDVDMGSQSGQNAQPNPEETMCKYNLHCTNRECKFAHQSPAAPPGTTVDVKDVCSFGAACKNRKCVGRHPSPANKVAHQSEQDCKFFPNCTNPRCPFRHPAMPPCRNGGECKVANCKFTHVKTACKFHPCTNRFCPFSHEEGQRGTFHDKVWVAGGGGGDENSKAQHVSERKFVDESVPEETVLPDTAMEESAPASAPGREGVQV